MRSSRVFFNLIFIFEILSIYYVQPICEIHEDEFCCASSEFHHYNVSSINHDMIKSSQTLHLTNSYYSGLLFGNINRLIIENYPYEAFPVPFRSSVTLHTLSIEHTFLNTFPKWLCTYNKNLLFIEINYSHIEQILEHDLNFCLNLQTLRISNSYLTRFTNSYNVELSLSLLYLNNNKLSKISDENGLNLKQFPSLRVLNLSHNQIRTISSESFNATCSLKKLDLSYSDVEVFQLNDLKYSTSLEILDLRGNNNLEINDNWYDYLPRIIKIYFPYPHFCCNYKRNFKVLNEKNLKTSKTGQMRETFIDEKDKQNGNENRFLSISFDSDQVCDPLPDQMTPCESLFSSKFVRFIFLMIVFVCVISNLTALIFTLFRLITTFYNRWSISTVLSSNLALADFISSIYLVLVGFIDIHFNENFHTKTQLWINSYLCTLAGFIYVFGIQSSMYALTLLTFERFYTILYSFKRQTPWPPKFTYTIISLGWLMSLFVASLPLININNFHANSLCVPFRIETVFDRLYLSLLIIFDICFIGIIITCNGLICFNLSKSHVHTSNDARATLKILTLVIAICVSRIPLIIFISLALFIYPTAYSMNNYGLNLNNIKLAILFLQPFSACFNPFMYSSLSTLKWTQTKTEFERPKPVRKSFEFSRYRSKSVVFYRDRGYHPLRIMSVSSLDYRLSSSPNTP